MLEAMSEKRRGLVLITSTYPYEKGEEFIEAEIGALCERFDRVTVLATQAGREAEQTRELPENAHAVRLGLPDTRRGLATSVATGLTHLRSLPGRPWRAKPKVVAQHAALEGHARRRLATLGPLQLGLDQVDETTIYAYWFHLPARLGTLIAERMRDAGRDVGRVVSRAHGFDVYEDRQPTGVLPLREALLAGVDAVHPVSHDGTEHIRAAFPEHAAKVSTRRLGSVDPQRRAEPDTDVDLHVVTASYCVPVKRLERVAPILRALLDDAPAGAPRTVRWTHIGAGPGLAALQAQAAELLPEGTATFVGHVAHDEMLERLATSGAQVFVNLSSSEGVPVTIMEACSLGLPVVATAVGGVPEIALDGRNATVLGKDFSDAEAVAALRALADDPALRARMGEESRAVWEQEFDAAVVFPAFAAELADGS